MVNQMSVNKGVIVLAVSMLLMSVGCSTSGCPSATPGTVGTASATSAGKLIPPTCQTSNGAGYSALVYSLDASGSGLNAAALDSSGTLASITSFKSPTLPNEKVESITIVNKKFLYIPLGNTTVEAFTIDHATGALASIPGSPYAIPTQQGSAMTSVADPQGRFLFVGSKDTGEISGFNIDPSSGSLTLIQGSPFTVQFSFVAANSLTIDAQGKYLYVGQADPSRGIMAFAIDGVSGALVQVPGSPFHLNVAQVRADPASESLLGTAQIQDQSGPAARETKIYMFSLESNGVPIPLSHSPFMTEFAPYDFMILPNGQFLYTFGVSELSGQTEPIEGFAKSANSGVLTTLSGSPYQAIPAVYTCQLGQSGSIAVCIDGIPGTKFSLLSVNTTLGAIAHMGTDLPVNNAFPFAITE